MNYENKEASYYANIRKDIIEFGFEKNQKYNTVLEVGAGYGETLNYLKTNNFAKKVVGMELFQDTKHPERYQPLVDFIFGDIEKLEVSEYAQKFDVILLPDVLEHLWTPTIALQKAKEMLSQNGFLLVSMPNIRHYSAFFQIFIKGSFKYQPSGIFDYTHARFYCKSDMIQLLQNNGWRVEKTESTISTYKGFSIAKIINKITFRIFEQFLTPQYLFKLVKNN
ncbi:MAG: class I SAM-dependent methyltransferase [Flavobacterium sp.]